MSDYYDKLVDNQLDRLSRVTPSASSTQRAVEAAMKAIEDNCADSKSTGILTSPIARLAIAAAVIAAVCLGIILVNSKTEIFQDRKIVKPDETGTKDSGVAATNDNLKEQLAELETMYAAGDVEGLIEKLTGDNLKVAIAAAGHLGKIGDTRAIESLSSLAAKWQGDGANPFEMAIDEIRSKGDSNPGTPQGQTSGENDPNSLSAGKPGKEYIKPKNIYKSFVGFKDDGSRNEVRQWIRMPGFYKSQSQSRTVIDNGTDRLTINHKKKTVQFEDSMQDHDPLTEHYLFDQIKNILKGPSGKSNSVLNEELTTFDTLVYDLESVYYGNKIKRTKYSKAWVEAETLRLLKIESLYPESEPNEVSYRRELENFDYSSISDSVFEMKVPAGYKQLPRIERLKFTGIVIDEDGKPMPGVKVCMQHRYELENTVHSYTDSQGLFTLTTPPRKHSYIVDKMSLMFFWAYPEDDPDRVAWTFFPKENVFSDYHIFAGPIPGSIEKIHEVFSHGSKRCVGATGIVLQMEKAVKIYGRVTDSLGRGLAHAEIQTRSSIMEVNKDDHARVSTHNDTWISKYYTDKDGYYLVGNIPRLFKDPSRHLYISAKGCNSKFHLFRGEFANNEEKVDIELLLNGLTISGTLSDNQGNLLARRHVFVSCGHGNYDKYVTTDEKGRFIAKDCPITENLKVTANLHKGPPSMSNVGELENYQFYKKVSKDIVLVDGKLDYDIELVGQMPVNVIEVEVVDSAGQPLPYFPVEIMFDDNISYHWSRYKLLKRTDINGRCTITGVPSVKELTLVIINYQKIPGDHEFDAETKKLVEDLHKEYSRFRSIRIPVKIIDGKKKYKIRVVVLTPKEYRESKKK